MVLAGVSRSPCEDQPSEMAQDFMVGRRAREALILIGIALSPGQSSQLKANDRCCGVTTGARYSHVCFRWLKLVCLEAVSQPVLSRTR